MEIEFNEKKFQELILHIANVSQEDSLFGATKLNKLLFYMDFGSYRTLGAPMTGATYRHLPAGPVPKELPGTRKYLVDRGDADIELRQYFTGVQERLVPKREADTSLFSDRELRLIQEVISQFWTFDARSISNYSHQERAWIVTEDFEEMPYELAWVSSEPLSAEQVEFGREIAAKAGLLEP